MYIYLFVQNDYTDADIIPINSGNGERIITVERSRFHNVETLQCKFTNITSYAGVAPL